MKAHKSVNQILSLMIKMERNSIRFYRKLARIQQAPELKATFLFLASREVEHKKRLKKWKKENSVVSMGAVLPLPVLEEYPLRVSKHHGVSLPRALLLAMEQEKGTFGVYTNLAETVPQEMLRTLFAMLAKEEAEHKLRLELKWDQWGSGDREHHA